MQVEKFTIPPEITYAIKQGIWPRTHTEAIQQNIESLVSIEVIHGFAPDEDHLFLYPPPFVTLQSEIDSGGTLSPEELAVDQINPSAVIVIGDFGPGSDTAVALDYSTSDIQPIVIRQQWRLPHETNRWLKIASTFSAFWAMLSLEKASIGSLPLS
ncbi:conserved hypothetical protein [Beggiatoa sp. PS]|nr:conserved hypothetical protein [Beggiatoa sp. PS]